MCATLTCPSCETAAAEAAAAAAKERRWARGVQEVDSRGGSVLEDPHATICPVVDEDEKRRHVDAAAVVAARDAIEGLLRRRAAVIMFMCYIPVALGVCVIKVAPLTRSCGLSRLWIT